VLRPIAALAQPWLFLGEGVGAMQMLGAAFVIGGGVTLVAKNE
jgi:drug/metabolite transporter (DMT)-like permease